MATWAFGICLIISVSTILWMVVKNHETTDRYYWTISVLVPIVILAYWLKTLVVTVEAAYILFCFIYIDSTILLCVVIFLMLHSIGIEPKFGVKLVFYGAAFIHLFVVWGCLHNNLYFKTIKVIPTNLGSVTKITGGPLRLYHYIYLGLMIAVIIGIIILGFLRKGRYSRRSLITYTVFISAGIIIYGIEWLVNIDFSLLPFLYVVADVVIAFQYERIHMHDISYVIAEHQENGGTRGYAVFDAKHHFLSCNTMITEFWPEMETLHVDSRIPKDSNLRSVFYTMIDAYEKRGETTERFTIGEKTLAVELIPFSFSSYSDRQGYLFDVRDASEEQRMMDLVTSYNERLNAEVEEKTKNILEMQRKLVTGMANMIENRDNNTGGHVKRTSDIIRIIIDEIKAQGALNISESFANDIVRAAPTHDLGKISIENAILNKPGKLTDEEYAVMKTHSAKSGELVKILLEGVEEPHFVQVAYNVARHHHERWDGRGYPDGLVGSMIPIEARIMAIADVYDALASKRSYKDPIDPPTAAKIMTEGMGTQFDPSMLPIFLGCREKLEQYYHSNSE